MSENRFVIARAWGLPLTWLNSITGPPSRCFCRPVSSRSGSTSLSVSITSPCAFSHCSVERRLLMSFAMFLVLDAHLAGSAHHISFSATACARTAPAAPQGKPPGRGSATVRIRQHLPRPAPALTRPAPARHALRGARTNAATGLPRPDAPARAVALSPLSRAPAGRALRQAAAGWSAPSPPPAPWSARSARRPTGPHRGRPATRASAA